MNERFEEYLKYMQKLKEEQLLNHKGEIETFIKFCQNKNVNLTLENFDYIQKIGIVANYPNIVLLLNDNIKPDKEGLIASEVLLTNFGRRFTAGYHYADNYIIMAHPYFRRSHHPENNFTPDFVQMFWRYNDSSNQRSIAIDLDRVQINMNGPEMMERDTWYGPKFSRSIADNEDKTIKLIPPPALDLGYVRLLFGNTHSLDIKWTSKDGIKIFQAEEFKQEDSRIIKDNSEYYPVKYLHAEFDISKGSFRHFDGAIHFYTEEEYYQRRFQDLNYNNKNDVKQKTLSQKLFKINGAIPVDKWVELVGHYLFGNPLIFEYFERHLPEETKEIVDALLKNHELSN
jgi:hypothetical protein